MKRRTVVTGLLSTPFWAYLPNTSAASQHVDLVSALVKTPRSTLTNDVVQQIRSGRIRKPALIKALLSAGVAHIEPRPVGFKYHAVLMVDAARRLSLQAEGIASWIPILWNVDYFKHSQARSLRQSDWKLENASVHLPLIGQAPDLFTRSMQAKQWQDADQAITRMARSGSMYSAFELMLEWAVKDFHSIGHKAILLSGVTRCLEYSGWEDSETILRGVTYALLADGNVTSDQDKGWWEKDYPENLRLAYRIPGSAFLPAAPEKDTERLLKRIRELDARTSSGLVAELLQQGLPMQCVWDAVFLAAAEAVINRPNIPMLHCVTVSHALYSLWQRTTNATMRRVIPLQAVSYVVQMKQQRTDGEWNNLDILDLKAEPPASTTLSEQLEQLGSAIGTDHTEARALLRRYPLNDGWWTLKQQLNSWLLSKSNKAHDFKYGAAVLETVEWLTPSWRTPYLAACSRLLMGGNMPDSSEGQKIDEWLGDSLS